MGRDSEVGSERAIHSVIQACPWAPGEGPKRKCAIDPGGSCVDVVSWWARRPPNAPVQLADVSLPLDRIRLDLECKPASSTDLRNQLDVTPGNTLPCKSAERGLLSTILAQSEPLLIPLRTHARVAILAHICGNLKKQAQLFSFLVTIRVSL